MQHEIRNNYTCLDANKNYMYVISIRCVIIVAVSLLFMIIASLVGMKYGEFTQTRAASFVAIVITPLCYLLFYFFYHKKNSIKIWQKPKFNILYLLIAILFAGICVFAIAPITNWISVLLQKLGYNANNDLTYNMDTWWRICFGFIGYAILPAIAEELIYRRVMLNGFLTKHSVKASVVMVAILFTLMHGSLNQFFYQLILGLILTILAYVTGSIMYSVVMHLLNNAVIITLSLTNSMYLVEGNAIMSHYGWNILLYTLIFVAGVMLILCILYLMNKYKHTKTAPENIIVKDNVFNFTKAQNSVENGYFYMSIIVATVIWITNTITGWLNI
ncbi:MAG: CPBP family intramembrane metalloprotease [Clostridia bacterium]|nr:CPBP family intramembrane metalloprotease [Clostridia bacterium]